jgi:hypothetical protein
LFFLFFLAWGLLVGQKLTATVDVLGPCDVPGTSVFLSGFLLPAGLILAPLVPRRSITNPNRIKAAVLLVGCLAIIGGFRFGEGCPLLN